MGRTPRYLVILSTFVLLLSPDQKADAATAVPSSHAPLAAGPLLSDSSHVSFGDAELGYYTQQSIWIWNGGSEAVTIQSLESNSSAFEVVSFDSSLQPGDSTTLLLRFRPFVIGDHSGIIEIISTSFSSPDSLTLSGTGIEPMTPPSIANHVVISEVSPMMGNSSVYDTGEFIELYNPLPTDFTFGADWWIISGDTAGTNPAEWKLSLDGGTIRGYGYYLIGDSAVPNRDMTFPSKKNLTNSGLRSVVQLKNDTTIIDAFGWDTRSVNLQAEGTRFKPTNASSDGKSFERKSRDTTSSPNDLGNGWDTDDNSVDFFQNDSIEANPQSSTSPLESPYISLDDRPRITVYSGDGQTDTLGSSLTDPLTVLVTGDESQPLKGVPITFSIVTTPPGASGQALSDTLVPTDKDGFAESILTLGDQTGVYEVEATAPGLIGSPVRFTATARGVPLLRIPSDSIDFGLTLVGTVSDTALVLHNDGTDTLSVSAIVSSASQRFIVRTLPPAIAPGDSGVSLVRFSATTLGTVTGTFVIQSNAATLSDTIVVWGTGVGVPIMIVDTTPIDFGEEKVFETKTSLLTISNFGNDTVKIFSASLGDTVFRIREAGRTIPPAQSVADTIVFSPVTFGSFQDTLVLASNSDTALIPLSGRSPHPEPVLSPPSLSFVGTPVNSVQSKSLYATNTSVNTLILDSVRTTTPLFTPDKTSGSISDDTLEIRITFSPVTPGIFADTVFIWNNSLTSPLSVPLSGTSPEPGLSIRETEVRFPETAVGDSTVVVIMLLNESVSPLNVGTLTTSSPQFSATTGQPVISGLDSTAVELKFVPTTFGDLTDTLVVSSNGGSGLVILHGSSPFPNLTLSVYTLDFGEAGVSQELTQGIVIRNSSINALNVDSLRTQTTSFAVLPSSGQIGGNDSLSVTVSFIPGTFGSFVDTLRIWSNALLPVDTVLLNGASPPPTIEADVGEIDFGEVLRDSASLRFTNASLNVLRIDSVYTLSSYFSLSLNDFPTYVSENETLSVWVHFVPDTIREYEDTIYVNANTYQDAAGISLRIPLSGRGSPLTAVPDQPTSLPTEFALTQNYPNPFNSTTKIAFSLPLQSRVKLEIYNLLGQRVATLVNGERPAGYYQLEWRASVPSGLYLCRLQAEAVGEDTEEYVEVRKMTLLK